MRVSIVIYGAVLALLCVGVVAMAMPPQQHHEVKWYPWWPGVSVKWSNRTSEFVQKVQPWYVPHLINFHPEDRATSDVDHDKDDDDDEYSDVHDNSINPTQLHPRREDNEEEEQEKQHHHHHHHEHHKCHHKRFDVYAFCVSLYELPVHTDKATVYLSVTFNEKPQAGHSHKFLATIGHYRSGKLRTNFSTANMVLADQGVGKQGFVVDGDLRHLSGLLFVKRGHDGVYPMSVSVNIRTTDPDGFTPIYTVAIYPGPPSHCDLYAEQIHSMTMAMKTMKFVAVSVTVVVLCVITILTVHCVRIAKKKKAAKAAAAGRANYTPLTQATRNQTPATQSPPPPPPPPAPAAVRTYSLGPQQQQQQQLVAVPLNMVQSLYPQLQQLVYSPAPAPTTTAPAVVHTNAPPTYSTAAAAQAQPLPQTGVTLNVPIN